MVSAAAGHLLPEPGWVILGTLRPLVARGGVVIWNCGVPNGGAVVAAMACQIGSLPFPSFKEAGSAPLRPTKRADGHSAIAPEAVRFRPVAEVAIGRALRMKGSGCGSLCTGVADDLGFPKSLIGPEASGVHPAG